MNLIKILLAIKILIIINLNIKYQMSNPPTDMFSTLVLPLIFVVVCFLYGVYAKNNNKTKLLIFTMLFWSFGLLMYFIVSPYHMGVMSRIVLFYVAQLYGLRRQIHYFLGKPHFELQCIVTPLCVTLLGYIAGVPNVDIKRSLK